MWASNEPMKDPADFQTWKSKGNAIQHNTCLSANGKKSSVVSWGGPGEGENEGSAQFILRSLFFHSSLLKKKKVREPGEGENEGSAQFILRSLFSAQKKKVCSV